MYNYFETMIDDVKTALNDNKIDHVTEDNYDDIYEMLFVDDSVTGNGSGSYTFSTFKAADYVADNVKLMVEAYKEFDCIDQLVENLTRDEWEAIDVTIRCYLLSQVLSSLMIETE